MKAGTLRRLMNVWPPYLFSGVRVLHIAEDWSEARVALRLRPWNRNYVGTHFGGSLFAMSDPFWMLLAMHRLGRDYYVWDRSGSIDFLRAARETVYAHFQVDEDVVERLRAQAADGERVLHWFETDITTASGERVACVRKQIYVRLKPRHRESIPADDGGIGLS